VSGAVISEFQIRRLRNIIHKYPVCGNVRDVKCWTGKKIENRPKNDKSINQRRAKLIKIDFHESVHRDTIMEVITNKMQLYRLIYYS
jgi:hypothetical protein